VVPSKTFDVTQVQKTQAKTSTLMSLGQAQQPIGNEYVLARELCLVAIASLADAQTNPRKAYAYLAMLNGVLRYLFAKRWLHSFPSSACCLILVLRRSSAYIFLSRLFSASNSFMRFIKDASIPQNLARHL